MYQEISVGYHSEDFQEELGVHQQVQAEQREWVCTFGSS